MRDELVAAHRQRALTPDRPVLRGTAQNPDVFFQAREACNPFYDALPGDRPEDDGPLRRAHRPALPPVRLRRPPAGRARDRAHGLRRRVGPRDRRAPGRPRREGRRPEGAPLPAVLGASTSSRRCPTTVRAIAVLDRTKEPGAVGEPLYLDVVTALREAREAGSSPLSRRPAGDRRPLRPVLEGVHPGHGEGGLRRARAPRRPAATTSRSASSTTSPTPRSAYDPELRHRARRRVRAVFFGLGADGTVGANKNSIKIIGEETDNYAQGYFVYDSKKSGAITISHLRFGPRPDPLHLPDQEGQLRRLPPVRLPRAATTCSSTRRPAAPSCSTPPTRRTRSGTQLPREVQEQIIEKKLKFYVIDAVQGRQGDRAWAAASTRSCRPASSRSPACCRASEAIAQIKKAIKKTYGKKGDEVVQRNFAAVDATLANLHEVTVPAAVTGNAPHAARSCRDAAPDFVKRVHRRDDRRQGRPAAGVSAFPVDGTWPTGTAQWEKRNIALEIPVWDAGHLHPVQQVRVRLPARRHPRQGLRPERARQARPRPSSRSTSRAPSSRA